MEYPGFPQHHGKLLNAAEEALKTAGFTNIAYVLVESYVKFTDIKGEELISNTADILVGMFIIEQQREEAKGKLLEPLRRQFNDRPGMIGRNGLILVAKRM
ncbi:hypothetical protein M422DRAFT_260240 [Sphaerobolus stellatus SS14]|uniref:Uncharacterized protein n=1 Tax=Sphaerobolus stellatus (strain SS14) TaxID=990650 RepID=A0A0C9UR91_SPHS4|nr:hypothetical protein M422DRAFT_260240 [Sphaerobolus stellatus SS14]